MSRSSPRSHSSNRGVRLRVGGLWRSRPVRLAAIALLAGAAAAVTVLGYYYVSFSRLIDNAVIVLENIFRYVEEKEIARFLEGRTGPGGLFPKEQYCGDIHTFCYSLNANSKAWRTMRCTPFQVFTSSWIATSSSVPALNRPPTLTYTPSVFSLINELVERAGSVAAGGSVTGIYTILAEGDDANDPIVDGARAILDGHVLLSRDLADRKSTRLNSSHRT